MITFAIKALDYDFKFSVCGLCYYGSDQLEEGLNFRIE